MTSFAALLDPILRMRVGRRLKRRFLDANPNRESSKTMKLYNVIHVWDVYVVAESEEKALDAAHDMIHAAEDPQPYDECTALEIHDQKAVRSKWVDAKPIVASDVSDADFDKLKGKTTMQVFELLHTRPKNENADKKPINDENHKKGSKK